MNCYRLSILHIYIATYEHLLSRCRYIRDVAINGLFHFCRCCCQVKKGSPYSIAERRVPGLIPVLGSQHARDVSHKPGGRLPLLSARPAVTLAILKRAATSFAAW